MFILIHMSVFCVCSTYILYVVCKYIHTHRKPVCTHLSLQCALTLQGSRLVASYQCVQAMCLTVYSVCRGWVANANVLFLYWCVHDTHRKGGVSDFVWVSAWMDSIRWSEWNTKLQTRLEHVPWDAGWPCQVQAFLLVAPLVPWHTTTTLTWLGYRPAYDWSKTVGGLHACSNTQGMQYECTNR